MCLLCYHPNPPRGGHLQGGIRDTYSALEPKVMAPFISRPGETPRRVQIERKKRLYAQKNVENLLHEKGYPPNVPKSTVTTNLESEAGGGGVDVNDTDLYATERILPLEIFDNTTFDQRRCDEWLPQIDEEARLRAAPGTAADWRSDGSCLWKKCMVLESYPETNEYLVQFEESKETKRLHRINIHFKAEDPVNFSRRFIDSHESRRKTVMMLEYNLFIDCMPTEDILPLTVEQINRILGFALNSKKLKDKLMDTSQLINEISIEYSRTMNKIIFDEALRRGDTVSNDMIISLDKEFPHEPPKHVPDIATVEVPAYGFPEQFSEFSFHSFLTKSEVISARVKVKTECSKVVKMTLFNTYYTKSYRLEEFQQAQTQASDQVSNHLKESWIVTLKNAIRNTFKDVGKGWFNLHEQNQETYEASKLKRFLNMTRYMMEDTLRYLVEENVTKFVEFIERCCAAEVKIVSTNEVIVVNNNADAGAEAGSSAPSHTHKKIALFALELNIYESEIIYTTSLSNFLPALRNIFDHGIACVQNISVLEPMIMENLFWSHLPTLSAAHRMESGITSLCERMEASMAKSLSQADEYLRTYEKYDPLLKLTLEAYIEAQSQQELSLEILQQEIVRRQDEKKKMLDDIPPSVTIGPFTINCKRIREQLLSKSEKMIEHCKVRLSQIPLGIITGISTKFEEIDKALRVKTTCPEDVQAQEEYIASLGEKIAELKEEIETTNVYYDALESEEFLVTDAEFSSRWTCISWPMKIDKLVAKVELALQEDQKEYHETMMSDQETFSETIEDLSRVVGNFHMHTDLSKRDVLEEVRNINDKLIKAVEDAKLYNSREILFGAEKTDYSMLKKIVDDFEPFYLLWTTAGDWKQWRDSWMSDNFESLDAELIDKNVNASWRTMYKVAKVFNGKGLEACAANCDEIKRNIEDYKQYVPIVTSLRNPGMRERHWESLSTEIGQEVRPSEDFTLAKIIEMGIPNHEETVTRICDVAAKEYSIEQALEKMQKEWERADFIVLDYRETGTYVVKVEEQYTQLLDDHIVMTQSMSFSPYKKPFEERIVVWEQQLSLTSEILDEWLALQRQWMYLEPIFSSEDIQHQLPLEGKRFSTVDRTWRKTLSLAKSQPHILSMCSSHKLLDSFVECNKMLDFVQKGLADYLETKRLAFARFFFLSNDELLQILSQTKNPLAVQPHLRKCFEAIAALNFTDSMEITGMVSGQKEHVPFSESMYPKGNVEDWLGVVESRMKDSVRNQIKLCIAEYECVKRTEWVRNWPAMVILCGSQVFWTKGVEDGLNNGTLNDFAEQSTKDLMDLTDLVRGELTKLERESMGALITIDVHARDVVQNLVSSNVLQVTDFEWVSQLRYYWESEDINCRMVQASLPYGYEYLGNTPRLVITPLTDRCYMTLMGAMHLNLGGAPAGPAGTGKTETTKDLAKAIAKQCVVFNCSDGLDYIAMGKFFKGLASAGAWACFDEFNRIDLEVLSVIAQQILTIQLAIAQGLKRFVFEDSEIDLRPGCTVYITMNPGYAGRSELPDNLKALFRPCAMMVPDYALIGEICLYSFGFRNAKHLSRKMVATFRLCSEQLSSQDHYDYGMRAVKSVITAAGNLKREFPSMDEDVLLLRALRDVNVPKFLSHDLPLFNGIISDLFPGVEIPKVTYDDLIDALGKACAELKIQAVEAFITKVIQLYETTIVRHGLMLVGPTGGGKTMMYRSLAKAMSSLHELERFEKVRMSVLNPKSITMGQLYGEFDEATHEWTDGVLACHMRTFSEDTKPDKKWIMFDGPVDAIWIENMNTVLDDNKKLCLVSGEIIQMSDTMTMMFEVEDLAVASPATVSRCGMVYIEPTAMGLDPLLESWIESLPSAFHKHRDRLRELFNALVPSAITFVRKNLKETVATTNNNLCMSFFNNMNALMMHFHNDEHGAPADEILAQIDECVVPFFLFSLVWSVGGSCDKDGRDRFDAYCRNSLAVAGVSPNVVPPANMTLYQFCFDVAKREWVEWLKVKPEFVVDPSKPFNEILVPTADTISYCYIIEKLMSSGKHVLAVGETGTGKTMNIVDFLSREIAENTMPIFVTFSARTSANQTQDMLDAKMDKRRKGVFGPPSGKKYIIHIDDLNMPQREKYFAQPPIELIRQWMDHGGWYERKPPCNFRNTIDVQFIGSMGPPGGGRNPVTNRLLRHFNFISFAEMSDESVGHIFTSILKAFFEKRFGSYAEVRDLQSSIVHGTVGIYNTIKNELLPTPAKSHYTFNLRDMAKVVQGTMRADPKAINTPKSVISLWLHELQRIFMDRLVNAEDREYFLNLQKRELQQHFGMEWGEVVEVERLIFGDFMTPGSDVKLYAQITDLPASIKVIEEYLDDYNSVSNAQMKLVLFLDAIEHVARVCRVIRLPLGNALLLGVGGSGRQSLSKLAAYMEEYEVFQIEISKGYGMNEWREDLKKVLMMAGLYMKDTVFLFTDTQIIQESFLEDMNNILNSGEVPNLMSSNDDLEAISNAMRPILQSAGIPVTKQSLYSQFVNNVRSRLHVVLCFSPVGSAFRQRLRMFPSLVNCCTIDWFAEWPMEALQSVANSFLTDIEIAESDAEKVTRGVINAFTFIHQSVENESKTYYAELRRHNYVTPTSYLELLSTFISLLAGKKKELNQLRSRLEIGLEKLKNTEGEVKVMKGELKELQPVLERTAQEADDMMVVIQRDKKEADETKAVVTKQEEDANLQAAEAKAIADDAQADLDKALPALDAAVASLKALSRNDIVEVKSLKNPPDGVKLVMEATCIMFEEKPKMVANPAGMGKKVADYWEPATRMLVDPTKFLSDLMTYDKDNIKDAIISKIEPYIDNENFTPEAVSRVSKACTSICLWVRAMYTYNKVALGVAPKRARLAEAQATLKVTMESLAETQAKLKEVEDNIARLEAQYKEAVDKKDDLARKVQECEVKLDRADKLIGGLGGEKVRWAQTVSFLTDSIVNVVGDVVISAGSIAYSGPFTPLYRLSLNQKWLAKLKDESVPHTEGVTLIKTLQDPVKIRSWNINGLPTDAVSIENAIIVSRARRWPLMIDPQGQANKWIKNMEKDSGLDAIKLSEKDYLRTLENGVRFGRAVLLENIFEELDAALEPLLLKQTFKQGGSEVIKIGDNVIPYHPDFRFYMTTKMRNPHYSPEISVKVSLLNFFVTPEGLEDQLLGIVVTKERPDLAEQKNQLVISNAKMKKELKDIEDKILVLLSNSQGNILDDEVLIDTLAKSKVTSNEIAEKVAEAEETEKEIDTTRELYRPVASRASLLFFCIADLASVDPMYQYSLSWFIDLFNKGIDNSEASANIEERGENLNNYFTYSLYVNVCRSLFERHKLMFAFLLCTKMLQSRGAIDPLEWRFFLAGATNPEVSMRNPAPEWLTEKSWTELMNLSALPNFSGFEQTFASEVDRFKHIFDQTDAHREQLVEPWNNKLSTFQKLCFLRCFRPDKVVQGIQDFITENLGQRFIEPPPFDLAICFKDSSPQAPLIFVLSSGADPMADLLKLAEEMRFTKKFEKVSLGQGQGPKAEKLLAMGMDRGMWVCLQNCHLATSWMPSLERIVENISPDKVHKDFRLWLTSMPSTTFPASVLQNGVKMTLEPPKGLKSNLMRTYNKITDQYLNENDKVYEWRKLLFGICLFHAVIQDRRKFGSLGWNIRYDFTDGDLQICQTQLKMFLEEYEEVPYKVIRFLCSEINYGGRVTDDKDRRLINNLLLNFINEGVCREGEYEFSSSGVYRAIEATEIRGFYGYIKQLPIVPKPEIFGLHENADITCDQNETDSLCATVLSLQPRISSGGGLSREQVIESRCTEILAKVPEDYDVEEVMESFPTKYSESMNTVLTQECIRYNGLLSVIKSSLKSSLKALKGLVVMSPDLELVTNSIFDNQVPALWASKAYPSLKPLASWVTDLVDRCHFIDTWIKHGVPPVYWVSGFFFPQAFITGTLQNYARKYGYPIDSVSFTFVVKDETPHTEIARGPPDGCYIRGLFLEGAGWDYESHVLVESKPKELYVDMPVIWLNPVKDRSGQRAGKYDCPVYKTLTRAGTLSTTGHSTNFVLYVEIPSDRDASHWINRSVALFTSLLY